MLSPDLQRRIIIALAGVEAGQELIGLLQSVEAYVNRHTTHFFENPIDKDIDVAGVPGTPDATAMSHFGAIHVESTGTIQEAHLHQVKDGTSGSHVLELYHFDYNTTTWTLLANVTLASGAGDFGRHSFTFVSEAARTVPGGDGMYLYLQATALMTAAHKPRGFIDIHWESTTPFAIE